MTGQTQPIAVGPKPARAAQLPRRELADLDRIIVRARYPDPSTPYAARRNVVPLIRPGEFAPSHLAPKISVATTDRPAPFSSHGETERRLALVLLGSLVVHAALFGFFSREPESTASIGEDAITVEIIVGANSAAGIADAPSDVEANSPAAAHNRQQDNAEAPQEALLARETQSTARHGPEPATEPPPQEPATPLTEEPSSTIQKEIIPDRNIEKPSRDPKQQDRSAPKPSTASAPAANNIGRGRMAGDANYQGLVAARLARVKQFPSEARRRREQGNALVSFSIDGAGRVTSVRLVRGTGFAALDQEVQAMVGRASPFPAPPDGVAVSFSVPVSFHLK